MATNETVSQTIARLTAENAALKAKAEARSVGTITFHVSKGGKAADGNTYEGKGGIMVRGFGRNPVTLYVEQWERLFDRMDDLKAFVAEHRAEALAINAAYRLKHDGDK